MNSLLTSSILLKDLIQYIAPLLLLVIFIPIILIRKNRELRLELEKIRTQFIQIKEIYTLPDEEDPLLGLFSTSGGMKVLKQTMNWSKRYEIPLTVCYIDLEEGFDQKVKNTIRGIFKRIRESDTVFRLSKSEILLILPDCKEDDAQRLMKNIYALIQEHKIELQYGLAGFKKDVYHSPNELIIQANQACIIA